MSALDDIATALGTVRDGIADVDTGVALAEISNATQKAAELGHEGLLSGLAAAQEGTEKLQALLADAQKVAEEIVSAVQGMTG